MLEKLAKNRPNTRLLWKKLQPGLEDPAEDFASQENHGLLRFASTRVTWRRVVGLAEYSTRQKVRRQDRYRVEACISRLLLEVFTEGIRVLLIPAYRQCWLMGYLSELTKILRRHGP